METKIDQDSFLSGRLTLWDQRGSRVIRGNVLAIPIEGALLYVEPKARETAPAGIKLSLDRLIRRVNEAFQNYLRFLGEKKFVRAFQALEQLEAALQELSKEAAPGNAGEAGTGSAGQ